MCVVSNCVKRENRLKSELGDKGWEVVTLNAALVASC